MTQQVRSIKRKMLLEAKSGNLTAMTNLASAYRNQGRWKRADVGGKGNGKN
jgi:hypothetical protein